MFHTIKQYVNELIKNRCKVSEANVFRHQYMNNLKKSLFIKSKSCFIEIIMFYVSDVYCQYNVLVLFCIFECNNNSTSSVDYTQNGL